MSSVRCCYWVKDAQHFKGTDRLFLQGQADQQYCCSDGTRFHLKFVSPRSTASLCTSPESSVMPLWESKVTKINNRLHLVTACCLLISGISSFFLSVKSCANQNVQNYSSTWFIYLLFIYFLFYFIFFPICTVHLNVIKVLFTHQLMHQWVVLKNSIKIYV